MSEEVAVGFYGKLPSLGDFVARNVPEQLVETWDRWLQESIAASRGQSEIDWLDTYLTAPMWRFWVHAGLLDECAIAGVLFPSVDRVGRCFPFTVFARLPDAATGLVVAERCADWFERVEDIVLAQLEDETRGLDALEASLAALGPKLAAGLQSVAFQAAGSRFPESMDAVSSHWHLPLGDRVDIGPTALTWLDATIARSIAKPVYWWSSGSAKVSPSWLITRGLPEPNAFTAMLSGAWHDWPWQSCETPGLRTATYPSFHMESAGTTHPGKLRHENQDSYIARPDVGLWAVADGMGGHEQGHVASQMASDALAAIPAQPGLAPLMQAVRHSLLEVNQYLHRMSLRPVNPVMSGTTVVVLLIRGQSGIALWAGDSRLYRLRDGRLEQLTVDHSESAASDGLEGVGTSNVITRAVGGKHDLDLEHVNFDVRLGDRFLLCSDGLYRELSDEELLRTLESGDAMTASQALERRVLLGQAADNVTVVVVDVQPGAD